MTGAEYTKPLNDVEEALGRVFPPSVDESWVSSVAGASGLALPWDDLNRINAPAWDLLKRGGKRWRTLVMILSHQLMGGSYPRLAELTALVELPHNGSLIIDDIEDRAEERRGGPAIHLIHGVDAAINTGNFLYFAPTYLIEQSGLSESIQLAMLRAYLRVMRCLHFGQGLDILWHNDHRKLPSQDHYLQMCRFKTGALSRLAAELGAASAGAPPAAMEEVGTLWEDIGVGFQILDDVKNLTTGNPGKRRGDDVVEGKKSLPVLIHAQRSSDKGQSLLDEYERVAEAVRQGRDVTSGVERAIALMEDSGALAAAADDGERLLKGARNRLRSQWPDNEARQGMEVLMDSFAQAVRR